MKRLLFLLVAICMALRLPVSAATSDFDIHDGVLIKYNGPGGEVEIPEGVTKIGDLAFFDRLDITSIAIPASITSFGSWSFGGCSGLTSIVIPASVEDMGIWTFSRCTGLTKVTIQEGVPVVGNQAFYLCENLKDIVIPSSVTRIGNQAFWGCRSLEKVVLPAGVTTIEEGAFDACSNLASLTIPSTVTTIRGMIVSSKEPVTLHVARSSLAEAYANTYGLSCIPDQDYVAPASPTVEKMAYASTQTVSVYNELVEFQMYALKDENGYFTNYIKLRDLAYVLKDNPNSFSVSWDGVISVDRFGTYIPNGTEMETPYSGDRMCKHGITEVSYGTYKDIRALDSLLLTDDAGNGYTYFKLRDLGDLLGLHVGWSSERGVYIDW